MDSAAVYCIAIVGTGLLAFAKFFPKAEGIFIAVGCFLIFVGVNRAFASGYSDGKNYLKLHKGNADNDSYDISSFREDEFD